MADNRGMTHTTYRPRGTNVALVVAMTWVATFIALVTGASATVAVKANAYNRSVTR